MSISLRTLSGGILILSSGTVEVEDWDEYQEDEVELRHLCYVVRFDMGSGLFERLKTSDGDVIKLHDRAKAQHIIDWIWHTISTGQHHIDLRQCPVFFSLKPEDLATP
jgi:hypothetical protein